MSLKTHPILLALLFGFALSGPVMVADHHDHRLFDRSRLAELSPLSELNMCVTPAPNSCTEIGMTCCRGGTFMESVAPFYWGWVPQSRVDTRTDSRHCGGCNAACHADTSCCGGHCVKPDV
ncbi:unnamed protein product [Calypogeia fissa]